MAGSDQKKRDQRWAERIQGGDCRAFERLFRAYCEKLCAFVEQYVSSAEVAEGLVQEVFLKVWERRQNIDSGKSIKSYLYTIARRQALDHLRHQRVVEQWARRSSPERRETRQGPYQALHRKELAKAVDAAIDRLPERRRLVFVLSRRHGLTYREIADTLDISVSTVETQMRRSFKALRQELAEHLPAGFFQ